MQVTDCGSFLYGIHREEGADTSPLLAGEEESSCRFS